MSRRKQKERKRQQREKRKGRRPARRSAASGRGTVDLAVRRPDLARPPVYVDALGTRIPDPYATLGLDADRPPTAETVRTAFRTALAARPPESDPERARELLAARDFFLDASSVLARTLGDLRVPDPEHFVRGYTSEPAPPAATPDAAAGNAWSSRSRLVALMTLYALLEEELDPGSTPPAQTRSLFD